MYDMKKKFNYFVIMVICLSWTAICFGAAKTASKDSDLKGQKIYWYERGVKKFAWMASDEMAVFTGKRLRTPEGREVLRRILHPRAQITDEAETVTILKSPEPIDSNGISQKLQSFRSVGDVNHVSPVFYSDSSKHLLSRRALTGEVIVQFPAEFSPGDILSLEKQYGMNRIEQMTFAVNTFLYRTADALSSLELSRSLVEAGYVTYAYPNWARSRSKRSIPDDPLFENQWHLNNTGQSFGMAGEDVNITSVWDSYIGSSDEVIAIVDDGLDINHEDLKDNVIPNLSWDYVNNDADPSHGGFWDGHGTNVAGVAAGRGFNGVGIAGAAPHAGLVGHRLLGGLFMLDANEANALTRNSNIVDIYSNSWGPVDWSPYGQAVYLDGPGPHTEDALANGVIIGRGGLGSIFVWAGGNGYDEDNSNYDGYANSRYTIAVAASTNLGKRAYYSEKGANILINAPSGGGTLSITTADSDDPSGYTKWFSGTSASTPLVSGVIALMLQANPELSWRDVQHILIETAEQNDPSDSDWTFNGAGYAVNHKYGFGRIDALAAVNAARNWTLAGPETSLEETSVPYISVPDNDADGISDTIFIAEDIFVEFAEIYVTAADHPYWGDLEIILISPNGTRSVLSEAHKISADGTTYNNWRFGSVRHYMESSQGNWTLQVRDLQSGDSGTLQSWTLKIYGNKGIPEPDVPTVTSATVGPVSVNSIFLKGALNPNGAATSYYFEYGTTDGYGRATMENSVGPRNGNVSVQIYVAGLQPDTTYHYRLVAENTLGITYGEDNTFLTSSTEEIEAFVSRFYELCLGREPDQNGLDGWVSALLEGTVTGADVALGFVSSPEFNEQNTTDEEYLTMLYQTLFNREPDPSGLTGWLRELENGTDRSQVLDGFIYAKEFGNLCRDYGISSEPVTAFASRFYQLCLNREPDQAGLAGWVGQLLNGTKTGADVALGFVFSREFINRNTSDEEYLYILYRAFFNREPDEDGYNLWLQRLAATADREEILAGFLFASEFYNLCDNYGIIPN
jgi:subtilisin-like proprotein convertase family protein